MDKPTAILSVNQEPDYLFLLPVVAESWRLQGWDVLVNMTRFDNPAVVAAMPGNVTVVESDIKITSTNHAIYSQCIRLYMPLAMADDKVFVLSDADMFIASDFILGQYRDGVLNAYGKDLTDYHYPVCYIMCRADIWKQVMGANGMTADLTELTGYNSVYQQAWVADQDILTKKILSSGALVNHVQRGTDKNNMNLPLGRWDRYGNFKKPAGPIHDVHLMRDPLNHIGKLIEICATCYPHQDWNWIKQYANEFRKSISGVFK